jgi:acyl-CoA thioester hydrolase
MTIFKTECRVRYAETDSARVVHYSAFFLYFEVGRMEMWRELGLPYFEQLPIVETYCRYLAPVRFDDLLEIHSFVVELRSKGFRIGHRVYLKDSGTLVAEGFTSFVTVGKDRKPTPVFEEFQRKFTEHLEKGATVPMASTGKADRTL